MSDTFTRLFRVLQLVPRAPRWMDTDTLANLLSSEGIDVEKRTLQRDLVRLEGMSLGLTCVDRAKPFKWSFAKNAAPVLVPGLDPQAALVLQLVEMHLRHLVPRATLKALQMHIDAARPALEGKPMARWLERVRVLPRHQPLVPPKVSLEITGAVHEALLEGRPLEVRYRTQGQKAAKDLVLHPLGLVHRDAVAYLVAVAFHYDDVRIYPLHRMVDASIVSTGHARTVPHFDLDAYIQKGDLGFRVSDGLVDVVLLFEPGASRVVEETPLSPDQLLRLRTDGRVEVRARVPDTHVLRSWLLGFGGGVEVLRPVALRRAIRDAHRAGGARYDARR